MEKYIEEYKNFEEKKKAILYALSVLNYDLETVAPKSAVDCNSRSVQYLFGEYYDLCTSSEYKECIKALYEKRDLLDKNLKRKIDLEQKSIHKLDLIPKDIYQAFEEICIKSNVAWKEAKEKKDFSIFSPYLKKVLEYSKMISNFIKKDENTDLYSILLDDFEEGNNTKMLDAFFDEIKERILPLIHSVIHSNYPVSNKLEGVFFDSYSQMKINPLLADSIGYDLSSGAIGLTEHPFTDGLGSGDVRITTNIDEKNVLSNIYSVLHESGHAILEQNIPDVMKGTILGSSIPMSVHESQSRFFENVIGRSMEYMDILYPILKNNFPKQMDLVSKEELYQSVNVVQQSLIRTEADELTYCIHIIIRYELEKDLINGKIEVEDLPRCWNQKYKEYLEVEPRNDSEGVLQDVHWSSGFGYFPSYALGNAIGLQILNTMQKQIPVFEYVQENKISEIVKWLKENVYQYIPFYTTNELLYHVTGETLNSSYYCDYLAKKYSKIYSLEKK